MVRKVASFNEVQAEALDQAEAELVDEDLATKQDLKEMERRLGIRLGTMMGMGVGIVAALVWIL